MIAFIGYSVYIHYEYRIIAGNHLHIAAGENALFWFDVRHSNRKNDIMFQDIETELLRFTPDLVLVEGGANRFEGNREESILDGESSFATYIARQNQIQVEDIEPPFPNQIAYLETKYSTNEILAIYLIRQIASEALLPENRGFDFESYLMSGTEFLVENGLDYTFNDVNDILKTINNFSSEEITNENWRDVKAHYIYVMEWGSLFTIYNDIVDYRNIYLVQLINEKKEYYHRIFIVMGGQHLIDTEPSLRQIF